MLLSSTLRHLPPRLFPRPRLIPSTTTSIRNLSSSSSSSSSTASTTPKRRTLYDLAFIASAGIGVSGLLIWTNRRRTSTTATGTAEMKEGDRTSFTVPVLNQQTGTPTTKTLSLLSQRETNLRLHSNEASYSVNRKRNPVFRYDTNVLESNNPVEDDSCCVILEREGGKQGVEGDLMFWGVFDGHSGWQTSRLLSSTLVSYVARELDLVFKGANPYLDLYHSLSSSPSPLPDDTPKSWSSFFSSSSSVANANAKIELDTSVPILQAALKNSFLALDSEIVHGPITLLTQFEKKGGLSAGGRVGGGEGGLRKEGTENLNKLLPALSGSCALLAFLDVGRNKLHVACTGDSRAVMGTWEPELNGHGGKWRVEVLSEDQTGKNLNEVKRMQSEHPASESDTVISRGRVLGGLEPSRAFGDARYKWPVGMQERLGAAFHPGSIRGRPRNYLTPPYVTAIPEVVSVDLSEGIAPSASGSGPTSNRFLVLATDGLYDRLSNEEIISLVGAHLTGTTGTQSRSSLLSHLSPSSSSPSFTSPHVPRNQEKSTGGEEYIFEDSNLSTHLIRNALGGARREQVSVLLSIPAPLSRRYRDDMTVTVILLGDSPPQQGAEGGTGTGGVQRRDASQGQGQMEVELGGGASQIKAKL